MAAVYRTALVVALEKFFGRVQISAPLWRSPNTARTSGRPSEEIK
jgi:hypothetical protein